MKDIKKILLTLALLITAVTGARAAWTGGTYTATANEKLGAITVNGDATLTINSDVTVTITGGINVASGTLTVTGPGTLVVTGAKGNDGNSGWEGSNGSNGGVAISGKIIVQGGATVTATGGNGGNGGTGAFVAGTGGNGGVAFAGTLTYKSGTVTANGGSAGSGGYIDEEGGHASSGSAGKAYANDVDFTQTTGYSVTNGTSTIGSVLNQTKVVISGGTEPAAASGPEVDWDKAKKTGKFTMPGGNVTLEPEYYPQAALTAAPTAINDVPATTDGAIVKAGTVKNIGETETAQGTVMYYVSKTALDDAALLALAADKWTADVPTAESLAQGQAYVYYYVRGNDSDNDAENFSDGDIKAANKLEVTIAAEPTYAVTFAEGVNPDAPAEPEWTASPATGVTKGETVTVTYTGSKKVIGVKAEKKAAAAGKTVDLSTYSGDSYEVTEDVTFTGTTNNEISILYKGEGYEVTLDNVNAPKCFIAAWDDNYTINVKLKGTSRLAGISNQNGEIFIGEAAAGGTVILVDESPLGGNGTTVTINGGTVKAKTSDYYTVYNTLEVNGGAVYIEAADGFAAVNGDAEGKVTLYGWNGSTWETYSNHRYLSTDNSKAPSQWTW